MTADRHGGAPFSDGSISLGLHAHTDHAGAAQAAALVAEGVAAEAAGFDGVTVSEHHAGFPGYMPQPLLVANWVLAATSTVWAGPNPVLLGLRNPRLLAEELAWTAARFPGRVGATVVAGYARSDFEAVGVSYDERLERLPGQLHELFDACHAAGPLEGDRAIAAFGGLSTLQLGVNSVSSARRAGEVGIGIVFPGGEEARRLGGLARAYRDAGGRGSVMCIVNVWLGGARGAGGAAWRDDVFRRAADPAMRQSSGFRQGPFVGKAEHVAEAVSGYLEEAAATAVNIRLNVDGAQSPEVVDEVGLAGAELIPALRDQFGVDASSGPRRDIS